MTVFEIVAGVAAVSLWAFALVAVVRSNAGTASKLIWGAIILLLPVVGSLVYLLTAPTRVLDFDVFDKPYVNERQEHDQEYEMTHRPLG